MDITGELKKLKDNQNDLFKDYIDYIDYLDDDLGTLDAMIDFIDNLPDNEHCNMSEDLIKKLKEYVTCCAASIENIDAQAKILSDNIPEIVDSLLENIKVDIMLNEMENI